MDAPPPEGKLSAGQYRLLTRLGSGGTGDVYLARHPVLGSRFAVKVFTADFMGDEAGTRRLKRDAEVVSRLNHPNIVSTVDFGDLEDGRFYLVMEYVDGQSLRKELRRLYPSLIPLRRALRLLKQLCHGLTVAHDLGVIHRAIKPANVLLKRSPGGDEQVKLVDFGLAKVIAEDGGSYVTRNRKILGTPAYMAPEQLTGAPVDRRADIYSVGVVAFQMMTGDLPFSGQTPIHIIAAQQSDAAPELSLLRPADELKVPRALEKIIMQCLAVNREERPSHVAQVTEAVLMALSQVPEEDERPSTITMAAGSGDEAARWGSGDPRNEDTAEIDRAKIDSFFAKHAKPAKPQRKLTGLTPEQKRHRVWNAVNKQAFDLAQLLAEYRIAPKELRELLSGIAALQKQEVDADQEIAVFKETLEETDAEFREQTGPLRDALLNLRLAHGSLAKDHGDNAAIIGSLDQQIQQLESRMGALTAEAEAQQKKLEAQIETRRAQLLTVRKRLGETQLIVLQLLRQAKQPSHPPDVLEGYAVLESLLRHVAGSGGPPEGPPEE